MPPESSLKPFQTKVQTRLDYANELNPQQYAAVTADPGPALVIAGAGAGKTRTLTYRVAWLLEQGIPAHRILLLTFTNKAAREMMQRVASLLGTELPDLWGGTFHSIGNRFLRRHAECLGYRRDFSILDRKDANDLLKACLSSMEVDTRDLKFPKIDVLAAIISLAVNLQSSVRDVIDSRFFAHAALADTINKLAKSYARRKEAVNSMDFDDLLSMWFRLLEENPEICERYQRRFQFILVDEYQDTNRLQAAIIDRLAARHHNLMVVGDDSQSIYAWRGATHRNILEFPQLYSQAKIYKVEINYRSTPEILLLANAAIANNFHQIEKILTPARPSGEIPAMVHCESANIQAEFVAERLMQLHQDGIALNSMAVLYRSHFHALELQLELTRRNIPFSITSGIRFFEQAHIKDVTAYLKLVCNPRDEVSFKRIALRFPGIGAKGAGKLWNALLAEVADRTASSDLVAAVMAVAKNVPRKAADEWENFALTLEQLCQEDLRQAPAQMIQAVIEAGYEDYLKDTYANAFSRLEDLEQLAGFATQFEGCEEFLAQLALLTNLELEHAEGMESTTDQVRLSTIHQAKGLEFDAVFLIMLSEGLFPSRRSLENPDQAEEERRLFYVAVTRAKSYLYLCNPRSRAGKGYQDYNLEPSRFLSELPKKTYREYSF